MTRIRQIRGFRNQIDRPDRHDPARIDKKQQKYHVCHEKYIDTKLVQNVQIGKRVKSLLFFGTPRPGLEPGSKDPQSSRMSTTPPGRGITTCLT